MFSKLTMFLAVTALPLFCASLYADEEGLSLSYNKPAQSWEREALPIGNGRLGAMIFGGVDKEHIQFNEDSLWIGDETDTGAYQAFGDLYIELGPPNSPYRIVKVQPDSASGMYSRKLDLSRSVHTVSYEQDGVKYKREYFASNPDQVIVMRLSADKPGAYTGSITLTDTHKAEITADGNRLTSSGNLAGYTYSGGSNSGKKGIKYKVALDYEAQVLVLNEGGSVKAADGKISFTGADSLTILLAADTDFINLREKGWKGEHPHKRITAQLAAAAKQQYNQLLQKHIKDYQGLFNRCMLDIGKTAVAQKSLPTDQRLAAYKAGTADPELEELVFQYARYLMISCSRPGCMPANLQGLWNMSNKPPWRSDYHSDVNLEMNYWFVDQANLSECFEPLAEWVNSIRDVRKAETKAAFGTRGWISHAENGAFGGSTWKWSKGDAAWIAQNLWDHYAYTLDREYLETRAYPVIKELCEFWEDNLKELPDGTLVSPNGFSPEHGPTEDGVSFDQQLVWDLFTNYIEASEILDKDPGFRKRVAAMKSKLLGPKIGRWGQLQEWMVDRDDPKDQHRHLSHMIAVYPSRQISPLTTPELAAAARVSMNARGDGSTGWSRAWKILIWARLHDGDHTYRILKGMLQNKFADNLFDIYPPFQIDGNFGYAAGICEMLVQSHMRQIQLLPSLPKAWPTGSVKGLKARGNYEVDISWEKGALTTAEIRAGSKGTCRLRTPVAVTVTCNGKTVDVKTEEKNLISFPAKAGSIYEVVTAE